MHCLEKAFWGSFLVIHYFQLSSFFSLRKVYNPQDTSKSGNSQKRAELLLFPFFSFFPFEL